MRKPPHIEMSDTEYVEVAVVKVIGSSDYDLEVASHITDWARITKSELTALNQALSYQNYSQNYSEGAFFYRAIQKPSSQQSFVEKTVREWIEYNEQVTKERKEKEEKEALKRKSTKEAREKKQLERLAKKYGNTI